MEYKIKGYQPEKLFHYFEEISAIPRGSGNEKQISDFLIGFAEAKKLDVYRDKNNNVIIKKRGSSDMKDIPVVMLQAHLDMVCEKRSTVAHDFEKEGLNLIIKDGVVSADGTTLGSDNGAAIAVMLEILSDDTMQHPPLECVFTTEEETSLCGARVLDPDQIKADIYINMDSTREGVAVISSAGGLCVELKKMIQKERIRGTQVRVQMGGLQGGHSGMDIAKERQNVNVLMARIGERLLKETDGQIVSYRGGEKNNAIARECEMSVIYSKNTEAEYAKKLIYGMSEAIKAEIREVEPEYFCEISVSENKEVLAVSKEDGESFVRMMRLLPNGVYRKSGRNQEFVVSSSNIGTVYISDDKIMICITPRASIASLQEDTKEKLALLADLFEFEIQYRGEYAGWNYREKSYIRDMFSECYKELYGTEMEMVAVHAGLECSVLLEKIPRLDAISVGPELNEIHTPDENMSLDSLLRFYQLIKLVLEKLVTKEL